MLLMMSNDETYLVYNDEFDEINPIVWWITDEMLTCNI